MSQHNPATGALTYHRGGIIRGPVDGKRLALVFTGGSHGESALQIAETLREHGIKAGLFLTGEILNRPDLAPIIQRWNQDGHYIGPHSEKHLLYASWDRLPKLLVTRDEFTSDLQANFRSLARNGIPPEKARVFIPPYEHYTEEISTWAKQQNVFLINYTTGTHSHADYLPHGHPRFISGKDIVTGILDYEALDPQGLRGFILLMHVGTGPQRTKDLLADELHSLLTELRRRGYEFERVDRLIGFPQNQPPPTGSSQP